MDAIVAAAVFVIIVLGLAALACYLNEQSNTWELKYLKSQNDTTISERQLKEARAQLDRIAWTPMAKGDTPQYVALPRNQLDDLHAKLKECARVFAALQKQHIRQDARTVQEIGQDMVKFLALPAQQYNKPPGETL